LRVAWQVQRQQLLQSGTVSAGYLQQKGVGRRLWRRGRGRLSLAGQSDLQLAVAASLQQDAITLLQWRTGGQLQQATVGLDLDAKHLTVGSTGGNAAYGGSQLTSGGRQRIIGRTAFGIAGWRQG
jgi:hypothetical protein